jgi:hypothetical protein
MKCTSCESILDEGSAFCSVCGSKIEKILNPEFIQASAPDFCNNYNGKRGSQKVGKANIHYGQATHAAEVGQAINTFLIANGYKPNTRQDGQDIVIEVKKTNIIKWFVGLNKSATIRISVSGNNLMTTVGEPQWIDKIIGVVIGSFWLYFIWLIVAFGIYEQWQLFKEIKGEIELFLASKK